MSATRASEPRVLFYLEHAIQDASLTRSGDRRVVSKRMLYVEFDANGVTRHVHYAPYLDYRPLGDDDPDVAAILDRPECSWIDRELEKKASGLRGRERGSRAPDGGSHLPSLP